MLRRLFTPLSVVSLGICGMMLALSLKNSATYVSADLEWRAWRASLCIVRGQVAFKTVRFDSPFPRARATVSKYVLGADDESDLDWVISDQLSGSKSRTGGLGFYIASEWVGGDIERWLVIPAWAIPVLGILLIIVFPKCRTRR